MRVFCKGLGESVDRPILKMDFALSDEAGSRPLCQRRAVIGPLAPADGAEEPDGFILGAIALEVAGEKLLMPARLCVHWSRRRSQQHVDALVKGFAVLPDNGLTEPRIAADLTQCIRDAGERLPDVSFRLAARGRPFIPRAIEGFEQRIYLRDVGQGIERKVFRDLTTYASQCRAAGITIRFVEQTVARLQGPMTSVLVRSFKVQIEVDRAHGVRRGELFQHVHGEPAPRTQSVRQDVQPSARSTRWEPRTLDAPSG